MVLTNPTPDNNLMDKSIYGETVQLKAILENACKRLANIINNFLLTLLAKCMNKTAPTILPKEYIEPNNPYSKSIIVKSNFICAPQNIRIPPDIAQL